ncbi:MAG: HAD family hydrolase [Anaerolineae bacterium]|nr:HAD-IB family hydrolase [Anaerolineae bacterium]MDW8099935.1 HAD family hydrolase [Anaerolineae bacterium]
MGAPIAAFFDLDHTILTASSGRLFVRYLRQIRAISRRKEAAIWAWSGLYLLRLMDYPRLLARLTVDVAGQSEAAMWRTCWRWFDEMLVKYISEDAKRAIIRHRAAGHLVAIVTGSTLYAAGPVAAYLGLGDHVLATRLEVQDGHFTGRLIEPACYGKGKVYWAERYAAARGIDLSQSYFYTDSVSDLPLLERVGHPVAVNPDWQLRHIARTRGWPIIAFR